MKAPSTAACHFLQDRNGNGAFRVACRELFIPSPCYMPNEKLTFQKQAPFKRLFSVGGFAELCRKPDSPLPFRCKYQTHGCSARPTSRRVEQGEISKDGASTATLGPEIREGTHGTTCICLLLRGLGGKVHAGVSGGQRQYTGETHSTRKGRVRLVVTAFAFPSQHCAANEPGSSMPAAVREARTPCLRC